MTTRAPLLLLLTASCATAPAFTPDELPDVAAFQASVRRELGRSDDELFVEELLFELPDGWRIQTLDVHGLTGTGWIEGRGGVVMLFDAEPRALKWRGSIPVPDTTTGEPTRLVAQGEDGTWFLACAGRALEGFDDIHRFVVCDEIRLVGTRHGTPCLIVGDEVRDGSFFDPRFAPMFSLDGTRIAYGEPVLFGVHAVVAPVDDPADTTRLLREGVMQWPVALDRTGAHWSAKVTIDDEEAVLVDGEVVGRFDRVFGPVARDSGSTMAWRVDRDGKKGYVVGAETTPMFDSVSGFELREDGFWGFVGRDGEASVVVLDNQRIEQPVTALGLGGRHGQFAYAFRDAGDLGVFVWYAERVHGPFPKVDRLLVSESGSTLLIGDTSSEGNRWWRGDLPVGAGFDTIEDVVPLDGGDGVMFVGHDAEGAHLVTPTARSGPWDWISGRRLSIDGRRVAFVARRGREVWRKVLPVWTGEGPAAALSSRR